MSKALKTKTLIKKQGKRVMLKIENIENEIVELMAANYKTLDYLNSLTAEDIKIVGYQAQALKKEIEATIEVLNTKSKQITSAVRSARPKGE